MKATHVLGFMFDPALERVVLLFKKDSFKTANGWNAPGGKIDINDIDLEEGRSEITREFYEETGIETFKSDWYFAGSIITPSKMDVAVYATVNSKALSAKTKTDEPVKVFPIEQAVGRNDLAQHVAACILMCKSMMEEIMRRKYEPFVFGSREK